MSSLDADSWFAFGSGDGAQQLAWHIARLHRRLRLFASPEASVERIGSMMSYLWKGQQHPEPASFMNRVALLQADVLCAGHDRDEILIDGVTRF